MSRVTLASYGFLVLIPLMGLWLISLDVVYWGFGIERMNNAILGQNFYEIYPNPPVPERMIYGGLAAIPVLILRLISFWFLWKMFYNFARKQIMVSDTVYHLKQYAKFAVLGVVAYFFMSGIRRWSAGEFDRFPLGTHFQFHPHETSILFTAAIIYVASKIIEEGNRYKIETESYV
ncbi:MAG: hypothetical protein ABJN69_12830 [Hellea sp.]